MKKIICLNGSGISPKKISIFYRYSMRYTPKIFTSHITQRRLSTFLLIKKGRYRYSYDGGQFEAADGDLIYIPYGATYAYEILTVSDTSSLQIEFDVFCDGKPVAFSSCPIPTSVTEEPELRAAMEEAVSLRATKNICCDFRLTAYLYRLLSAFADRGASQNSDMSSRVLPAVEYLDKNFYRKINISDLAVRCSMCESNLRRIFKKETGFSPIEYRNQLRIRTACRMLRYTYISVGEISDSIGYDNIYQFSSMFKKIIGVSPKQYARQHNQLIDIPGKKPE